MGRGGGPLGEGRKGRGRGAGGAGGTGQARAWRLGGAGGPCQAPGQRQEVRGGVPRVEAPGEAVESGREGRRAPRGPGGRGGGAEGGRLGATPACSSARSWRGERYKWRGALPWRCYCEYCWIWKFQDFGLLWFLLCLNFFFFLEQLDQALNRLVYLQYTNVRCHLRGAEALPSSSTCRNPLGHLGR